jgi:hypothetical protein
MRPSFSAAYKALFGAGVMQELKVRTYQLLSALMSTPPVASHRKGAVAAVLLLP